MTDKGMRETETKPTPDPTILTTEQLFRESDRIEKLFRSELDGAQEKNRVLFHAIDDMFEMIESRRQEQKIDTKVAVDAALSAAEKAVREQTVASEKSINKSETMFAEQLKQQNQTFSVSLKGLETVVDDLKARVVKIEGMALGASANRDTQRLDMGTILAVLSLAAVVVFAIIR